MTGSATPTVVLVDDDAAVLSALSRVLRAEGIAVLPFDSAEAFLASRPGTPTACIVLDVTMPGIDGLALQERLADAGGPAPPIVFLTGHGDIPMTVRAMKAGAADFLTKPVRSDVLVAAVRSAINREVDARRADGATEELRRRFASLTDREREVLAALSRGLLNKQIAADLGIVEQTVKYHRARIMERMQARTAAELMHMAATIGVGAGGRGGATDPGAGPPRSPRGPGGDA